MEKGNLMEEMSRRNMFTKIEMFTAKPKFLRYRVNLSMQSMLFLSPNYVITPNTNTHTQ
jgi:hypothetical protein